MWKKENVWVWKKENIWVCKKESLLKKNHYAKWNRAVAKV